MILDANVTLKWVLNHPDSPAALAFSGRSDLRAPSTMYAEVAHVLTRELRARRLTADQMRRGWEIIRRHPLAAAPIELLIDEAVVLSVRLHATSHDCLYLALALRENDQVVTADARFYRAAEAAPQTRGRVLMLGA